MSSIRLLTGNKLLIRPTDDDEESKIDEVKIS